MGAQWKKHFDDGRFRVVGASDAPLGASEGPLTDFWTQPWSFGALPDAAPELLRELQKSDLVIFKGTCHPSLTAGDLVRLPTYSELPQVDAGRAVAVNDTVCRGSWSACRQVPVGISTDMQG